MVAKTFWAQIAAADVLLGLTPLKNSNHHGN
jgi:hypothetical protein